MAETALNQFSLDCILWVPTYRPLYKPIEDLIEFEHRLAMVKLAIANHPQFKASAIEQTGSISYAIDTLSGLQALHPASQWYWILGLDAVRSLSQWQRRQQLIPQCTWLVAPRGEPESRKAAALCATVAHQLDTEKIRFQWQLLEMPLVNISSGVIRQYCVDRHSIRYWVPDAVRGYIQAKGLYQPPKAVFKF
jgi:nicotinate-nucleotide adenylyltransferase